ncbi:MAG: hypothetical protein RIG84_10365 [Roseovarius sp.]
MRQALLAGLVLVAAPAVAQEWFTHSSGELRAYHGDWLAVCADEGEGPCRAVTTAVDPGSQAFFDLRLAIHRLDASPDWAVEVMDRGMPGEALTALSFSFDGEVVDLPPGAWEQGDFDGYNAVDTVVIRDAEIAADLVARMKPGTAVVMTYRPRGEGDGVARFSLRGVTAAADAIEARVLARQE